MNKENIIKFKIALKDRKLKTTSARLALLDMFERSKKPLSVKDLAERLDNTGIDTVTLYRNVDSLESIGLLKKIFIDNKQSYYELSSEKHHHHLVCKKCGKIEDIEDCKVAISNDAIRRSGFDNISHHSLEFFGICKKCAGKN